MASLFSFISNVNEAYNMGFYQVSVGVNSPTQFGCMIVIPYRGAFGNTKPDFAAQLFFPNGDDAGNPNSAWYRTSNRNSWNAWQKIQIV